jgi:hypothetical protein
MTVSVALRNRTGSGGGEQVAVDVAGQPGQVEGSAVGGEHCGLFLAGGADAGELHGAST